MVDGDLTDSSFLLDMPGAIADFFWKNRLDEEFRTINPLSQAHPPASHRSKAQFRLWAETESGLSGLQLNLWDSIAVIYRPSHSLILDRCKD